MIRTLKWIASALPLLVLCLVWTACGYRFAGQGGAFPEDVKHIYVEMLANNTSQTGLENTITNQIIFEFTRRNKAALASSLERADALLSGVVTSKTVQTVAPRGKDAAAQRRVTLSLNLKLTKVILRILVQYLHYRVYQQKNEIKHLIG